MDAQLFEDKEFYSTEISLETLPPDELAKIMRFLEIEDVQSLQLVSRGLRNACQDERVWHSICDSTWASCTDVRKWLPAPGQSVQPRGFASRPPTTYKDLFHLLHKVEKLAGLWRVIGEGCKSALVSFKWTQDGIEGHEVSYHRLADREPDLHLFQRIAPRRGLTVAVDWDGDDNNTVTLRSLGPGGTPDGRLHRSPSAEAAAAVSFGTPQSQSMLGASPQGTFEHAWLEFMSSSVQKSSKMRRRHSRGEGAGPMLLRHLRRVVPPVPSARHPFAGMWLAECGGAGLQIFTMRYDFSGRAARIVAEKVTGDAEVPAGRKAWWALAAALPVPWPSEEAQLLANLEAAQALHEEELLQGIDGSIAALFLEGGSDDEGPELDMDGVPDVGAAAAVAARRVVAMHMGAGQIMAHGSEEEWEEGRLWVHADGTLTFWWVEGEPHCVPMRRIDAHLGVGS